MCYIDTGFRAGLANNSIGTGSPSSTASATTQSSSWHSSTGILEPLYCTPYTDGTDPSTCANENGTNNFAWLDINDTKNKYPHVPYFVIVNPGNGSCDTTPGHTCPDPKYQRGIANLTKSGVIVLGYIHTSWDDGSISYTQARNWINDWSNWYGAKNSAMGNLGIKGVFIDEMSNNPSGGIPTYYKDITDYIHGNFTYSIGNPGVETVPQFIRTMNTLNTIEANLTTDTLPTNQTLQGTTDDGGPVQWHTKYDKSDFSWLAYCQTSLSNVNAAYIHGVSLYAGLLYPLDQHGCRTGDSDAWSINPPQSWLKTLASYLNSTSVLSTIQAKDTSNNLLNATITIHQSGNLVRNAVTNNTSFTYNATSGWQFVLNATQLSGHTFCKWDDGSTNPVRTIAPTQSMTYVATYTSSTCP